VGFSKRTVAQLPKRNATFVYISGDHPSWIFQDSPLFQGRDLDMDLSLI